MVKQNVIQHKIMLNNFNFFYVLTAIKVKVVLPENHPHHFSSHFGGDFDVESAPSGAPPCFAGRGGRGAPITTTGPSAPGEAFGGTAQMTSVHYCNSMAFTLCTLT